MDGCWLLLQIIKNRAPALVLAEKEKEKERHPHQHPQVDNKPVSPSLR